MLTIIYGRSGSGKSRSLKNLPKDKTLLINVQGKPLPFKGAFPMTFLPKGNDGLLEQFERTILGTLKKYPETNVIVIDDAGYMLTKKFMAKHKEKAGSASFDLFNDIADDFWRLLNFCNNLPSHINTYIMLHESQNDYGDVKFKTIGKLLDEKVCIEGCVTVCLRCMTDGKRHWFQTQNSGSDVSKSPEEMFPEETIENDLLLVDQCIRDYYSEDSKAS